MRTTPFFLAALLAFALLPVSAQASQSCSGGPFAGVVQQGQTASHGYCTNPPGTMCLMIYLPATFIVTLEYAPPTDTLTLTAGGLTANGIGGVAALNVPGNWFCEAFTISVTGASVTAAAPYAVEVTKTPIGAVFCWDPC